MFKRVITIFKVKDEILINSVIVMGAKENHNMDMYG